VLSSEREDQTAPPITFFIEIRQREGGRKCRRHDIRKCQSQEQRSARKSIIVPIRCLDIQTPIFHDTYGDYPKVPDLRNDSRVRDRLYYACTGWIGRNVFFRWKTGHTPSEFTQRNRQLAAGAKALARYTNDRRFLYLPGIQSAAESWLPDMIGQYQKSKEAWNELTERWFGR